MAATPARVVSLIASSTEMVCLLGCGDRLVARSHECDFPEWVRALPAITAPVFHTEAASAEIDREVRALAERALSVYRVDAGALDALAPDLVITQTQCEVCAVSLADVERALAARVTTRPTVLPLSAETLAGVWRDLRRIADALGVPERGVQQASRLMRRMAAIAERAATLTPRPRVAMIEWIDPLMAAGHWIPELIAMAHGEDVFGTPGARAPAIDWDDVAAADPDVIWIAPCGFDLERTGREAAALRDRPEWTALRAVRDGAVFLGDGNAYFSRPGPRLAETLEILAETLHPSAFRFGHEGTGWASFI